MNIKIEIKLFKSLFELLNLFVEGINNFILEENFFFFDRY